MRNYVIPSGARNLCQVLNCDVSVRNDTQQAYRQSIPLTPLRKRRAAIPRFAWNDRAATHQMNCASRMDIKGEGCAKVKSLIGNGNAQR